MQTVWKDLNQLKSYQDKMMDHMLSEQYWVGVVGPIKAQCHIVVSCNRLAVIKADSGKMAEHHFEIEKGCEDIGEKEMLKKMYMTDFNEPCLKDADPVTKGLKEISYEDKRFLKIMQKEISKVGTHQQLSLPLRNNNMNLSHNQNMVEMRLMNLKRLFQKGFKFFEDTINSWKK